jgi:hypothetical protein
VGDAPPPAHLVSMPSIRARTPVDSLTLAAPTRGPSKALVGVAVAGVLALIAVGVGVAVSGGDETVEEPPNATLEPQATTEGSAGTSAETETETGTETEALPHGIDPESVPAPEMVSVTFTSRPEGATVTVDGRELGVTPIVAPLPLQEAPVVVRFSLPRHVDDQVSVVPVAGARVEGRLRPIRRSTEQSGTTTGFKMSF